MTHVTPEYPRAYKAASEVDPMVLASALDHIARTAAASRSQTRRVRWIETRATFALEGREYRDIDVDLPRNPGPDTREKLQKRMAYHIALKHQAVEALRTLVDVCERQELEREAYRPTEEDYQQALATAKALIEPQQEGAPA